MKKHTINYNRENKTFLKDGKPISDQEAREIFDAVSADWSQGAYQEMVRRVMG